MQRAMGFLRWGAAVVVLPMVLVQQGRAWGHDGHSMINRLAASKLPADVPEFLRSPAAQDAMDFYGPVPDNEWRSYAAPELSDVRFSDHEINLEWAGLIGPLPRKRYDYVSAMEAAKQKHPEIKQAVEAAQIKHPGDIAAEVTGMLPYAADEYYEQLEAAMHEYRARVAAKQDTRPEEEAIVYIAGIMGHFVADGSQPMHTSIQYAGWLGPNPNGYTTDKKVHTMIEGDYVHDNIKLADFAGLVPAKPVVLGDVFEDFLTYIGHSNSLVEKMYQLEKAGGFAGAGTPEGKAFIDERLAAGATELRDVIYTAWVNSAKYVEPYHGS